MAVVSPKAGGVYIAPVEGIRRCNVLELKRRKLTVNMNIGNVCSLTIRTGDPTGLSQCTIGMSRFIHSIMKPKFWKHDNANNDSMYHHALAILDDANKWGWPITSRVLQSGNKQSRSFHTITARLLYYLIVEAHKLGGSVLDQFWLQLGNCHPQLAANIEALKTIPFDSSTPPPSPKILLQGLDPHKIDFAPVLHMAAEFFTHLCVAMRDPGGPKSATGTPFSVSDIISKGTEELLQMLAKGKNIGKRRREILKELSFKRDGTSCLLTDRPYLPKDPVGATPILAHVIPNSVHGKADTLKCIAMFAGDAVRDTVIEHLNEVGNVMNLESNAHLMYDALRWGIEAKTVNGKIKYIYRLIPDGRTGSPWPIQRKDGQEIRFGRGPDGSKLGKGPLPSLCNLQLAVAHVLKMSGAADIISQWKEEADDSEMPHLYIASEEFCNILDAKLFLSGHALIAGH